MTIFTYLWLALGAAFCVIEGIALFNKRKGDTLSEHVWLIAKVGSGRWTFVRLLVAFFMVWLTGHFVFGWWTT